METFGSRILKTLFRPVNVFTSKFQKSKKLNISRLGSAKSIYWP